jgi:hypothetical protein
VATLLQLNLDTTNNLEQDNSNRELQQNQMIHKLHPFSAFLINYWHTHQKNIIEKNTQENMLMKQQSNKQPQGKATNRSDRYCWAQEQIKNITPCREYCSAKNGWIYKVHAAKLIKVGKLD